MIKINELMPYYIVNRNIYRGSKFFCNVRGGIYRRNKIKGISWVLDLGMLLRR
jgi:hypothetical protein